MRVKLRVKLAHDSAFYVKLQGQAAEEAFIPRGQYAFMRLFVALDLAEPAKSAVAEAIEEMTVAHREQRFTSPGNLHYTMKFLGEVPDDSINDIAGAVRSSLEGAKPFRLHVRGLGYFGSRRFAKVLWVGAHEGREEMVRIASALENGLSDFRKENKEPSPHLTICRPRGETLKLIGDIEKEKNRDFGWMDVKEIKLKKSTLTPRGAAYGDVDMFRLHFD